MNSLFLGILNLIPFSLLQFNLCPWNSYYMLILNLLNVSSLKDPGPSLRQFRHSDSLLHTQPVLLPCLRGTYLLTLHKHLVTMCQIFCCPRNMETIITLPILEGLLGVGKLQTTHRPRRTRRGNRDQGHVSRG